MTEPSGEEGSTLLEVLVAFVILTGAVVLSFRIFGDGLAGLRAAEERSVMVAIARRELARLELSPRLEAGRLAGDGGGDFAWSVELTPKVDPEKTAAGAVPFRVKVTVGRRSSSAHPVSIETTLLAAPAR
jgi:general secretion pathway protein I